MDKARPSALVASARINTGRALSDQCQEHPPIVSLVPLCSGIYTFCFLSLSRLCFSRSGALTSNRSHRRLSMYH
jgi:hypothetical protein